MERNTREKTLLIAALVILGALVLDKGVVTPALNTWEVRSQKIKTLNTSFLEGRALVEYQDRYKSMWEEMVESALPENVSEAENIILNSVDEWARTSRLSITSLKPRSAHEQSTHKRLEFIMSSTGSLKSISRFLWELETAPMALLIEEIEIDAREGRLSEMTATIRFSGLLMSPAKAPDETGEKKDNSSTTEVEQS